MVIFHWGLDAEQNCYWLEREQSGSSAFSVLLQPQPQMPPRAVSVRQHKGEIREGEWISENHHPLCQQRHLWQHHIYNCHPGSALERSVLTLYGSAKRPGAVWKNPHSTFRELNLFPKGSQILLLPLLQMLLSLPEIRCHGHRRNRLQFNDTQVQWHRRKALKKFGHLMFELSQPRGNFRQHSHINCTI